MMGSTHHISHVQLFRPWGGFLWKMENSHIYYVAVLIPFVHGSIKYYIWMEPTRDEDFQNSSLFRKTVHYGIILCHRTCRKMKKIMKLLMFRLLYISQWETDVQMYYSIMQRVPSHLIWYQDHVHATKTDHLMNVSVQDVFLFSSYCRQVPETSRT